MTEKYERIEILEGATVLVNCYKTDGSVTTVELENMFEINPEWLSDMAQNYGYIRFDIALPFERHTNHKPVRIAGQIHHVEF